MTMKNEFRAKKILGALARFKELDAATTKHWRDFLRIDDNNTVCGLYTNGPGFDPESILVTSRGLYLHRDGADASVRYVSYESIQGMELCTKDPLDNVLPINLASGDKVKVQIVGLGGPGNKFQDIFSFVRFLRRVSENASA